MILRDPPLLVLKQVQQLQPGLGDSEGKACFWCNQAGRSRLGSDVWTFAQMAPALAKVEDKHCVIWGLPREVIRGGLSGTWKICMKNVFLSNGRLVVLCFFSRELKMIL